LPAGHYCDSRGEACHLYDLGADPGETADSAARENSYAAQRRPSRNLLFHLVFLE
jgi:hypothetical protein